MDAKFLLSWTRVPASSKEGLMAAAEADIVFRNSQAKHLVRDRSATGVSRVQSYWKVDLLDPLRA
jgi:hypothetical protein